MTRAVITAIGPDQPGRVEEISQFVYEAGGNIETSRMVNLGGYFAMMLIVAGDPPCITTLDQRMEAFAKRGGLQCQLLPIHQATAANTINYRLLSRGADRAGGLHQISHLLRTLAISIESVNSRVMPGEDTGAGEFELEMQLSVPPQVPVYKLREYLGHLWNGQPISWELVESSPSTARSTSSSPAADATPQ